MDDIRTIEKFFSTHPEEDIMQSSCSTWWLLEVYAAETYI